MSDDEGSAFDDLDLPGRLAVATQALAPFAAQLGATPVVEDEDGEPIALEPAADDDLRELVLRGRAPSGREVRIGARLHTDDLSAVVGEVALRVGVDNRMGCVELVHLLDGEEPDPERMTPVSSATFVHDHDAAERDAMLARLARLPTLAPAAERVLAEHDLYALAIGHSSLAASLGWLDDLDELAATEERLPALIAALDDLAARIETLPPEGFATCRFCGARVSVGLTGCSTCGAPL